MTKMITDNTCNGVMVDQDIDNVDEKIIMDGKYITPVHVFREIDLCMN